jgi:hypothetical protein
MENSETTFFVTKGALSKRKIKTIYHKEKKATMNTYPIVNMTKHWKLSWSNDRKRYLALHCSLTTKYQTHHTLPNIHGQCHESDTKGDHQHLLTDSQIVVKGGTASALEHFLKSEPMRYPSMSNHILTNLLDFELLVTKSCACN